MGSLLLLACGVVGAAAIHRVSHDVRLVGDARSTWPEPPEPRRGEWTHGAAVPMEGPIVGVWGASADNVWAWSERDIIHWDGRAWSRAKRADLDPGTIEAMSGSAYDVYAPELERLTVGHPIAFGSFERRFKLPFVRGHRVGPGQQLWAIDSSGMFLGRFDGRRWTVGSTRNPLLDDLNGVWFASETLGWAIAGATILRWDGHEWTREAEASWRLRAIWGSGPDDVWVVGEAGQTIHWEGETWVYDRRPRWPDLTVLDGRGPNDVWSGGCSADAVVLLHWDGGDWREWDVPSNQYRDSRSRGVPCLLLASSGDRRARALIDDRLRVVDAARPPAAGPSPEPSLDARPDRGDGLTALVTADATKAWVLSSRHHDWRPSEPTPFAVQLAHGAPGKIRSLPGHGTIKAVWARASNDVWAVGTDGLVLHYDGEFWTRMPVDTTETFVAVHGAGRTVWIAGTDGTLLRRAF